MATKPQTLKVTMTFEVQVDSDLLEFLIDELEEDEDEVPKLSVVGEALDEKLNSGEVDWENFLDTACRMKIDVEAEV